MARMLTEMLAAELAAGVLARLGARRLGLHSGIGLIGRGAREERQRGRVGSRYGRSVRRWSEGHRRWREGPGGAVSAAGGGAERSGDRAEACSTMTLSCPVGGPSPRVLGIISGAEYPER